MNICPRCQTYFDHYAEYHEHMAMNCSKTLDVKAAVSSLKNWAEFSGERPAKTERITLGKYKGPMDKAIKAKIVAMGESRLGASNFLGFNC